MIPDSLRVLTESERRVYVSWRNCKPGVRIRSNGMFSEIGQPWSGATRVGTGFSNSYKRRRSVKVLEGPIDVDNLFHALSSGFVDELTGCPQFPRTGGINHVSVLTLYLTCEKSYRAQWLRCDGYRKVVDIPLLVYQNIVSRVAMTLGSRLIPPVVHLFISQLEMLDGRYHGCVLASSYLDVAIAAQTLSVSLADNGFSSSLSAYAGDGLVDDWLASQEFKGVPILSLAAGYESKM